MADSGCKKGWGIWRTIERSVDERRRRAQLEESQRAFRRVTPWII